MRQSSLNVGSMVLRTLHRPVGRIHNIACSVITSSGCSYGIKSSKPLRVLFCGSDHFSCASLRAVHQEQLRSPESIASIDVLIRPGKLSGRGLKSIREVPIKSVAQELGLTLHERDTFTGWLLPQPNGEPINLIVAVSFGLLVPPRILKSAEYGGINVHPSLLPDFRGPAPLQHTLLAGETHTGVTLQTLHPEKFDHGAILAQTSPPGLEIPKSLECTYQELLEYITPKAAEMLVQGIRDRLFIPDSNRSESSQQSTSSKDTSFLSSTEIGHPLRHAPKITTEDRQVNWKTMTADEILRRDRVLGRLWSFCQPAGKHKTRIVFEGLEDMLRKAPDLPWFERPNELASVAYLGKFFLLPLISSDNQHFNIPCVKYQDAVVMRPPNGDAILVREITVEGSRKKSAVKALAEWARSGEIE